MSAYPHEEDVEDEGEEHQRLSDSYGNDRVDSPFSSRPPTKKKRDDGDRHHYDDRERRPRQDVDRYGDKPRGVPSRGREFVRGRGVTRNRGGNRGSMRGGSFNARGARQGNGRDYYSASYERGGSSSSNSRRMDRYGKPFRLDEDGGLDREDNGKSISNQRHGPGDELSDISGDENSGIYGGSSKHGDRDGSSREPRDNRQQQPGRGSDNSRDEKPKNAWNHEAKQPRPLAPPPVQNAWTKNQPLLPDPPRSERISDPGIKEMKHDDKPRSDVWNSQESRHDHKDNQRSDFKDPQRQEMRENHRQDIKENQESRDNQQHDIRDNQRQDTRDSQRQDTKISQRQESRDFQCRDIRDAQNQEPRDSRQESKDNRPERDVQRHEYRDSRKESRDSHRQDIEKSSGDSQNITNEGKDRPRYDRRDDRDKDKDNRRRQNKDDGNRRNDRDRFRGEDGSRNDIQDGNGKEKMDKRDRDQDRERYKDRRNDRDTIDENGQLIPRGEPSRRGRGGNTIFFFFLSST